ncbi:hypothetical protein YC2023_014524 [Brassica napus]
MDGVRERERRKKRIKVKLRNEEEGERRTRWSSRKACVAHPGESPIVGPASVSKSCLCRYFKLNTQCSNKQ